MEILPFEIIAVAGSVIVALLILAWAISVPDPRDHISDEHPTESAHPNPYVINSPDDLIPVELMHLITRCDVCKQPYFPPRYIDGKCPCLPDSEKSEAVSTPIF